MQQFWVSIFTFLVWAWRIIKSWQHEPFCCRGVLLLDGNLQDWFPKCAQLLLILSGSAKGMNISWYRNLCTAPLHQLRIPKIPTSQKERQDVRMIPSDLVVFSGANNKNNKRNVHLQWRDVQLSKFTWECVYFLEIIQCMWISIGIHMVTKCIWLNQTIIHNPN